MQKKPVLQSIIILAVMVMLLSSAIMVAGQPNQEKEQKGKIKIIATLFPQYDFVRQIAGDRAEVVLLLPPGMESHSYDPSPSDIVSISSADLLIYTGEYMEPWVKKIMDGVSGKVVAVDTSENILLCEDEHEHEHEAESEHHAHEYDPHIWTDPVQAGIMVDTIVEALCLHDSDNADEYRENAVQYKQALNELDQEFKAAVELGKRKELVFGGRFALYYFAKRYDLTAQSAYEHCSVEGEPSPKVVAELIDKVRAKQIPAVYFEELSEPKIAETIAKSTGAKTLLFHSCHNVSKDEMERGETYISLMRQNLQNLKEGLN